MLDGIDAIELFAGQFARLADNGSGYSLPDLRCELLAGGERLPRHPMPRASALLRDDEHAAHITRASKRSFSTSFAAASFALPSINWVCLVRCGR